MILPRAFSGQVPGYLVLDKRGLSPAQQAVLIESAVVADAERPESREPTGDLRDLELPGGVIVDPAYPAVPIGNGAAGEESPESLDPRASRKFVVRAFIAVDDPARMPEAIDGLPVFSDPMIASFLARSGDPPVGSDRDVRTKLNTAKLAAQGLDGNGVAVAIVDTGIHAPSLAKKTGSASQLDAANSWTPRNVATPPGLHRRGHGTMCAYDVLLAAPRATLLDFAVLLGRQVGDHTVPGTLANVLQAYRRLWIFWTGARRPSPAANYNALVISNSWGIYHPSCDFQPGHPNRYIDNRNHPLRVYIAALAQRGADVLFAAGNCGTPCPSPPCLYLTVDAIRGAAAYHDVLTVAGCDVTDARVCYSSQGPSIFRRLRDKPDLTAYAHFLGSQVFGPRRPDGGTSAACPVAAGCVAALRTMAPPSTTPPASLFDALRATARPVGAGWNADYGHGIIDPVGAAVNLGLIA